LFGCVGNTALFGVAIGVVVLTIGRVRRMVRGRRGLCGFCGYPRLSTDVCPECGKSSARTQS
jgi:hypothetical protein